MQGDGKSLARGRDLDQQRIVKRRDDRTAVPHAAVETHSEAASAAVGQNLAVVRRKLVFRILGGDAALDGVAHARHFVLLWKANRRAEHRVSLRDENLRADQVDAGDLLGDRVLDLDARVHLDEEPVIAVEVVEELDSAGVIVADLLGDARAGQAKLLAHMIVETNAGRDLDDLLMAALHGAIAFVEMQHVTVLVSEHLHLDVLGAWNVLFEEDRGVPERAACLGLCLVKQASQVGSLSDHAHSPPAAAERGLDDERKADLLRDFERVVAVSNRILRALQSRDVQLLRERASSRLVAHHVEQLRPRPNEGDAGGGAGTGEAGVLAEKAVARVDQISAMLPSQCDDTIDVEISGNRPLARANEVRLVSLEPVDAQAVLLRIDGNRAKIQFGGGPEDADGNLASVSDEQLLENFGCRLGG